MAETLHIIVADAQYLTRIGAVRAIQVLAAGAVIEEAKTSEELWKMLGKSPADVLILDIELLDFSIPDDFYTIQKDHPATRIMVITEEFDTEKIAKIWDTGVNAFILKACEEPEFEMAFRACLKNQKYYATELVDAIMRLQNKRKNSGENSILTPSEQEIIRLISQGLTTKEIAVQKHLSFHTIITHRRNIFKKLGINNSSELLMYAIKTGIVQTNEYYI
jgi:DNA-binding NarL/FixJ family response regulator